MHMHLQAGDRTGTRALLGHAVLHMSTTIWLRLAKRQQSRENFLLRPAVLGKLFARCPRHAFPL